MPKTSLIKMPELPEVENICRFLKKKILKKQILSVSVRLDKIVKNNSYSFIKYLKGKSVSDVFRRGKFIIIGLSNKYYLITHLKISGQLLYLSKKEQAAKHTHIIINFKNTEYQLRFKDVRQFGYMHIVKSNELEGFLASKIGPDFPDLPYKEFKAIVGSRKRIIKSLLLDQKLFSGIGNIYANEALFKAGVHPAALSSSLTQEQIKKLYSAINSILSEAIRMGGSSVDDYILPDTSLGSFQNKHKVYQKEGGKCPRCSGIIERVKQNGRSSWFCSHCQK
ncbi:MAG: bifunctional DNA-formamidopyrimidine glycosylase/DNA-(apurinic or apyrimidinic site) lyase [Candidatus Omnitrophica bacterium]|nr:bifunctional DNA-formamidopyrimidine glycosylase/DNA-(apurinic or apyrimidinic site) lyase [Candidatus Omnitrophota bacterium]